MRTLGIIVASIVSPALLPIVIVVAMERRAQPLDPPSGRPTALYWADRVFVSKAQFASWLEDRGVTYQEWVGRHPGASPWERRTASPVRPAKPAATGGEAASRDRPATEAPPLSERLRSLLGGAPSALAPAIIASFVGVILAMLARRRRAVGTFAAAAWRGTRARLHGADGAPRALAVVAGKAGALPGRLWAGARAGGSRLAGQGARPAMAAGGAPRLSLAFEPVPAVPALPTGASRGRLRRRGGRPSGADEHTQGVPRVAPGVRPVELKLATAVDELPQAAESELVWEAPPAAAEHAPEATAAAAAHMPEPVQPTPVVVAEHVPERVEAQGATDAAATGPRVEPMAPKPTPPAPPVAIRQMPDQAESELAPAAPATAPALVPEPVQPPSAAVMEQAPAEPDRAPDAPREAPFVSPVEPAERAVAADALREPVPAEPTPEEQAPAVPAVAPVPPSQRSRRRLRPRLMSNTRAPVAQERAPSAAMEPVLEPAAPASAPAAVPEQEPEPVAPEPAPDATRVPAAQVAGPVAPERVPVAAADVVPQPVAPQPVAPAPAAEMTERVAPEPPRAAAPEAVPASVVPEPAPASADEAREPVAPTPASAAAAEQEQEPVDALPLNDQAVMCTIAVWHGFVKSRFYARVRTPDGDTYAVAESPMFRRRGDIPERLPDAVKAHEALLDRLRAEGWRPVGSLGAWYASCLQPTVPALMADPALLRRPDAAREAGSSK